MISRKPAIFLDRDGVINALVWNPKTTCFESPHQLNDLLVYETALEAMELLQVDYQLFTISNQPSYAKGKTSLDQIYAIAEKVTQVLHTRGIKIQKAFYCIHHPLGIAPEVSIECECRKPKPTFLFQATNEFNLDLSRSWMVGDQDSDIQCGINAGCQTAAILNPHSSEKRTQLHATLDGRDLLEVASKIISLG